MRTGVRRAARLIGPLSYTAVDHKRSRVYLVGATDTVTLAVWLTVTFCLISTDTFTFWPALILVCTLMPYPPSGVVTFMVLVTGLWPYGPRPMPALQEESHSESSRALGPC
jgi:hypothetical protein